MDRVLQGAEREIVTKNRPSPAVEPPAAEQCSAKQVVEIEGRQGVALWWPQMGGYVGKAVIFADPDGGADVLVWHDGNFPFDGTCPNCGYDRGPTRIYVTDPAGWIRFGRDAELALEKLERGRT